MEKHILTGTELYTFIIEKYGHLFEQNCTPSFSNLVWQLVVNGAWDENKTHCFVAVISNNGRSEWKIGIAEDGELGYHDTRVYFISGMTYELANDALELLNQDLFGLMPRACMEIMIKSMRTGSC